MPTCWDASDLGVRDFTFTSVPSYPAGGLNHTVGGSKFGAFYGSYYPYQGSWFYTPAVKLDTGKTHTKLNFGMLLPVAILGVCFVLLMAMAKLLVQ